MALWHLYRMETDPNVGPLALTCMTGETPIKYTLYDSDNQVYDTTIFCTLDDAHPDDILALLTAGGYDPSEWHS